MELFEQQGESQDYMCDHTTWESSSARQVGSERFKLLYDIYHMQIMEGDLMPQLRQNHQYIAHITLAVCPDATKSTDTQEINYPSVMKAIVDTGYKGHVGSRNSFRSRTDVLASLKQGVQICDV